MLADNPSTATRCEERVIYLTRNGLTLVHPFYQLLDEYEQSNPSFGEFLPTLLDLLPEYSD